MRPHTERYQAKNRVLINGLKNVPCADCGLRYDPWIMDFDHVRGEKIKNISQMLGWPPDKIIAEASKCDVVCANCHRARTKKKGQNGRRRSTLS